MLADIESFFHRLRRHFDRSERAVRKFGLPVFENSGEEPGLLLIQIDGLSQKNLEQALEKGLMPFLDRLKEREKYRLHTLDSSEESMASVLEEFRHVEANPPPILLSQGDTTSSPARAKIDLVRGLPFVDVKLRVPCDPASHNGIPDRDIRDIDAAVRILTIEAHRSQRRDYHVWICSAGKSESRIGEERGFLLVPPGTWLPTETKYDLRDSELRAAAKTLFDGQPRTRTMPGTMAPPGRLSIMSYNVHSCIGMDGRVSPRRIARVIARQGVDIAAIQEVDQGRARSRSEDQAHDIAAELGFHMLYCPAVTSGSERYGHALLSRWPLEAAKIAPLPSHQGGMWPEPRAALWARVHTQEATLNILSTHLGLSAPERIKQMTAILGPEWLGSVLDREPVILCGDFNLTPGSAAHRLAASRLRDVAHNFKRGVRTFSSIRLVAQLDHIFVSPHFGLESVFAAQNDLTRVASDHLPLVAHLRLPGS